jgi:hypothetical protein
MSDRNHDRPTDSPMMGPGLRTGNCSTDTTTDRTTDTRKLGPQLRLSDGRSYRVNRVLHASRRIDRSLRAIREIYIEGRPCTPWNDVVDADANREN